MLSLKKGSAIAVNIWRPLSSDRSYNDRRDRTFSISALVVAAIATIAGFHMIAMIAAIADLFFSQWSQRKKRRRKKDKKRCTRENRDLNRSYDKQQCTSLRPRNVSHLFSHKNFAKTHSLNVNYVKKFKPRCARVFSPQFFNPIISNHILVILSHYLIMASHIKRIITLSYLGIIYHI